MMLDRLETKVASWYEKAPHMSPHSRKWLAGNIWWLALLGVVLGVIGIWIIFAALFLTSAVFVGFGGAIGAALSGVLWIVAVISMALSIIELVLVGVAISPLRSLRKKGWTLLFVVILINLLVGAVEFLFTFNLAELLWTAIFSGLGGYFLFEIRSYFAPVPHTRQ